MNRLRSVCLMVLALGLSLATGGVFAQEQAEEFKPYVGQPGKDVVWVPTGEDLVEKMLDLAQVTPEDYVIDLGSGDGRTVIAAAKRGATAMGIEYNPDMVALSIRNAIEAGVTNKVTFVNADIFESDFSKADVITMFLLPQINLKLRPQLLDMKPGTRIVSNSFTMEDWAADATASLESGCTSWCTAYLWIVPAKVEGKWQLKDGELILSQKFQGITGTLTVNGENASIVGKLKGDQISFKADEVEYSGQVNGDTISGTMNSTSGGGTWEAIRIESGQLPVAVNQ
jgi:precorrin-6B methylase 2